MSSDVSRMPPHPFPRTDPSQAPHADGEPKASPGDKGQIKRLFLGLYFPFLATDRLGRTDCAGAPDQRNDKAASTATVCVEKQRGAMRLVAADAAAAALGLAPGLTLAEARARVPDVIVHDANPAADLVWLHRIADLCERHTPLIAVDPPDTLMLDITGVTHLFGGTTGLISDLYAHVARTGVTMRHALAATPQAAWALARYGGDDIGDLPVAALRLGAETHTALRRAGLKTIGDLAARPTAPLTARFGAKATAILERMLGRADSRIVPRRTTPDIIVAHRFAEPVTHTGGVLATIAALVDEAVAELARRALGGRQFSVRLFRSDGVTRTLAIATSRPERDTQLVMRLFAERIDALADPIDPGFGFDLIRLSVPHSETLDTAQLALDGHGAMAGGADRHDAALTALVDRLATRVGSGRIRRLVLRDSHMPEQGVLALPVAVAAPTLANREDGTAKNLRPIHLFDPPQRVMAMAEVPDGPPQHFRWRGRLHEVVRSEGPERIAPPWWQDGTPALTRDYYRIEDSHGRRYWLFRHGLYDRETAQPAWYVHGVFA